jgi:hypothetical protein
MQATEDLEVMLENVSVAQFFIEYLNESLSLAYSLIYLHWFRHSGKLAALMFRKAVDLLQIHAGSLQEQTNQRQFHADDEVNKFQAPEKITDTLNMKVGNHIFAEIYLPCIHESRL